MGETADTDERTRVLWLAKGLGPGGAERLLLAFADAADHRRFRYSAAYLLPHKDHLTPALGAAGVPCTCLHGARTWDLRWLLRLRRLVREGAIEVVHLHSPLVAAMARPVLAAGRRRPAVVSTSHNTWDSFNPITRALDRLTAWMDDHRFAVSEPVRASMPARMAAGTEVLVHGVDVEAISARHPERDGIRRELGIEGERVVVTIANLRADKDHPNLFRAAERVLARHDDVVFLAIGQGQLEAELRADLAGRGLGDRFRMLGHQEDPIRFLLAADVFTLASRHEGLPISLLEAMATGLPAAVTAVGGVPDVVEDGVQGRLVPPSDPEALAGAIEELLEPVTNERMRAAAGRRARDFDIRPAVERQQEVYAELARRRRR